MKIPVFTGMTAGVAGSQNYSSFLRRQESKIPSINVIKIPYIRFAIPSAAAAHLISRNYGVATIQVFQKISVHLRNPRETKAIRGKPPFITYYSTLITLRNQILRR